ncbi:maleylpyruvate isomerase family mycothiol-dependent enzyme [Streptomyces sp. NBC_01465]|uniref:maleylpyruvate isomerase family mycothiol-dependent enzyme n=1 Tax=Streptomyces sp. NBC_01465 TaxID=2903878 RepID=UPI002E34AF02|nr:maleylpyruvate isomerase family mycothiol-dependent enzyme [Streptomyces sp. NBC_01465]
MTVDERDAELPGRLLRVGRDELIPLLRGRADADFDVRTSGCPEWTVREVLAHCGAVLTRVREERYEKGVFSPESNDRDIAERAEWSVKEIVDEVERGLTDAGPTIAAATHGLFDGIGLGEWVHVGDVRVAWGLPGAYGGAGLGDALSLLGVFARGKLLVRAELTDGRGELTLGSEGGVEARYVGDGPTLIRLCSGRSVEGAEFELVGAEVGELNLFG